jgi:ComF family protein
VTVGALAGRAFGGLLDMVLPPRCLGCGGIVERQGRLCARCWRGLTFLVPPQCRLCGYPLPDAVAEAPLCGGCMHEPPVFGRARAALRYDEGARGLILAFKHADRTDSAPLFGRWLARAGRELLADAELITPVPLHRWRLLRRGYNQAAVLAAALARETGLPLAPDLVQRRRATRSQQGLSAQGRLVNITPASFRPHPWYRRRLAGRKVVLVDDVMTTGATVTACCRVLLAAGAERVDVLTLARVVRDAATPI